MDQFEGNDERRQFPRYSKDITVDINGRVFPVIEKLEEIAEGKDISVGGLCFKSPVSHEKGARLSMSVRITKTEDEKRQSGLIVSKASTPIVTVGEVVRCSDLPDEDGYEIGIRFVEIEEKDLRTLIRHLATE